MQKHNRGFFFVILLPILLLLAAAYGLFVWKWTYSEGERAGFVQKLSKKGFVCKTWEGDLSMVALPGAIAEKFTFTVMDDAIAEQINKHVGKRVALHYEEKIGLPTTCFGETRHYIRKVKLLDEPPAIAAPAPAVVAPVAAPAAAAVATPATPAVPTTPVAAPSTIPTPTMPAPAIAPNPVTPATPK